MRESWNDNEGVSALRSAAESLSALADAAAARREIAASESDSIADLPIQDLPAHIHFAQQWEKRRGAYLTRRVHRPCPLCRSSSATTLFSTQDGYEYATCDHCALIYIPDVLPLDVWDSYFRDLPNASARLRAQLEGTISGAALDANRKRFGNYFRILRNQSVRLESARLLDVGTLTGGALAIAREFGIDAFGVEGLEEAINFTRSRRPDLRIALGHAEHLDTSLFGGRFDVVTLFETLEHTVDPLAALSRAHDALSPAGVIMVTVPNASNIQFSMLREYCFFAYGGYEGIGHVNMFTPETLRTAFKASGFELLHVETEFGTDWRQLAYYLQHRFNRIYCYRNLLRDGEFTQNPGPELSVLLNWLSPALTRIENAVLAGPIVIALAKRR